MSDNPIERLNYFNGQRLEAEDLRLEQEYHIRIQRVLSRSLFSPGVADGFDVVAVDLVKSDGSSIKNAKVRVSAGAALDDLGRAIVLVEPVELVPQARFLCVRYAEHGARVSEGECVVRGTNPVAIARWGGPERIVSEPEFRWRANPPRDDTRELVIAELALKADCTVDRVIAGARRFAVATQVSRVHSFALEGEKNIDRHNPKRIYFHVRGRRPEAVTLYLRAEPFSTLFYTELPKHTHELQIAVQQTIGVLPHLHALGGSTPNNDGVHDHLALVSTIPTPLTPSLNPFGERRAMITTTAIAGNTNTESLQEILGLNARQDTISRPGTDVPPFPPLVTTSHNHALPAKTGDVDVASVTPSTVTPTVTQKTAGDTGLGPEQASDPGTRTTKRLRDLSDLKIAIDDKPMTVPILDQLQRSSPEAWNMLAALNGADGQPMSFKGTGAGPIRLDLLDGLSFDPGEHWIDLSVDTDDNGGCIHYNLYIE